MFPRYFPYGGAPTYSYGRPNSDYFQALAEEEAARRQYAAALRAEEEARNRAARARLARQAYETEHNAYLSDEDEDTYDGYSVPTYGYGYPSRRRSARGYPSNLDRQRLAALELERERERERLRALEERERRRRMKEEEEEQRRRRKVLEEEEQRLQLQREAEERERQRLEQELLRRQQEESRESSPLSPFEEFFGLRPPRMTQSKSQQSPFARRARTVSPRSRHAQSPPSPTTVPSVQRTTSRSPTQEQIPVRARGSPIPKTPVVREPSPKPEPPSEEEVEAATKIQSGWRRHHALQTIAEQAAKFSELQKSFTLPKTLEYVTPGASLHSHEHISIPVPSDFSPSLPEEEVEDPQLPKLAYTPTNAPVHTYEEELSRILTKLDGVESGGDKTVREQRREAVRRVEKEAERIEQIKAGLWKMWTKQQQAATMVKVPVSTDEGEKSSLTAETMEVDQSQTSSPEEAATPSEAQSMDEQMVDQLLKSSARSVDASTPDSESMSIDATPEPAFQSSQRTPSFSPSSLPQVVESDEVMASDKDTESDVSPTTPEQPPFPLNNEKPQTQPDSAPKSDFPTKRRMEMLRPLFDSHWEDIDNWDFF